MLKILEPYDGKRLPRVETERLILRQRTIDDAEDIFAYCRIPEVAYPAGFPPTKTVDEERDYLENFLPKRDADHNLPSGYGITLKGEDKVIGSIDFCHRHADDVLEIGYLLHPDYWNQGMVTEAAHALLEIGFTYLNLHKIEIGCYDYNAGSRRVAEKLGFTLEATIRDRKDTQGKRCADLRYGLLKSEWGA